MRAFVISLMTLMSSMVCAMIFSFDLATGYEPHHLAIVAISLTIAVLSTLALRHASTVMNKQ